jgi:hypothetical protein
VFEILGAQPLYCFLFVLGFTVIAVSGKGHNVVLTFFIAYSRRGHFALAPEYILDGMLVMERTGRLERIVKFYRALRSFSPGKNSYILFFLDGLEHARSASDAFAKKDNTSALFLIAAAAVLVLFFIAACHIAGRKYKDPFDVIALPGLIVVKYVSDIYSSKDKTYNEYIYSSSCLLLLGWMTFECAADIGILYGFLFFFLT